MTIPETRRPPFALQAGALLLLALLGTLPFWLTDLDVRVAALFYSPGAEEPWPLAQRPLWQLLYQAAPLVAAVTGLGGLAVLAAGSLVPRFRGLRPYAVLVLAALVLGPGLIVNALLKDHWGRPRPHQVAELGGSRDYLPPLAPGGEPGVGKSFPCGHSSAGYLLGIFFPILHRRRPRLAAAALLGAAALGTLLGIGRMGAGDHFLSDVIWSAVIAYGVGFLLYYFVLRIPEREAAERLSPPPPARPLRRPVATALGYGAAAVALLVGVLAATPVGTTRMRTLEPAPSGTPPRTLRVVADQARVTVAWQDSTYGAARIFLKGRGFGLPGTRVQDRLVREIDGATYELTHRGVFTEKDTAVTVLVTAGDWQRIEVRTGAGDIRIYPEPPNAPELVLETGKGRVRRDGA